MPRISLDVDLEQHRQLKTLSAYAGLTMKEFLLSRIFSENAAKIIESKKKAKLNKELEKLYDVFFDKKKRQVVLSEEKWQEILAKVANQDS